MSAVFPDNALTQKAEIQQDTQPKDARRYGFRVSKLEVNEDLEINNWRRWKTRGEMVDALTIAEATALSFGIKTSAVSKLTDSTSPSIDHFEFRLITILAAAQQGNIELIADPGQTRVLGEKDLIKFSDFVRYVKAGSKTAVPEEFIDLMWDMSESEEARRKNFKRLPWKEQATLLAKDLHSEHTFLAKEVKKDDFLKELYAKCVEKGVRTSTNKPPATATLDTEFLRAWWKTRLDVW